MNTFFKSDISERYKHLLKKKNNKSLVGDVQNIIETTKEVFKDNKSEISGDIFIVKE